MKFARCLGSILVFRSSVCTVIQNYVIFKYFSTPTSKAAHVKQQFMAVVECHLADRLIVKAILMLRRMSP